MLNSEVLFGDYKPILGISFLGHSRRSGADARRFRFAVRRLQALGYFIVRDHTGRAGQLGIGF